jgi:transcriptional antiterminator RfaH
MRGEHEALARRAAPWIVVNTQPHREQFVVDNLRRLEFVAYCPVIRKRRSHARRVDMVLRPLFPNYLFVQVDGEHTKWRPLLTTHGVRTVVRAGDALSFIEDGFIAGLKAREVDGAIVRPVSPYRVGQHVQIVSGPFDQLVATIIEMDEKDRLVVLLELMNREIKVTVKSESVTPL